MAGIISVLYELYVRFMVWLGAEPPAGYEHLLRAGEAGPREYMLKKGDTLFSVARRFGIHYDLMAKANGIDDPSSLQPGQTIVIPPPNWDPATGPLRIQPAPSPEPTIPAAAAGDETIAEPELTRTEVEIRSVDKEASVSAEEAAHPVKVADTALVPEQTSLPFGEPVSTTAAPSTKELEPSAEEAEPGDMAKSQDEASLPVTPSKIAAAPLPDGPALTTAAESAPSSEVTAEKEMAFRYEVQRGDTVSSVSRRYGITVKSLVEANDIADPGRIFPGQKLIIPGYMSPQPEEPELEDPPSARPMAATDRALVHTVTRGDTLSAIAKRYGVTVRGLVEANDIEDPNLLRIGQRLIIPGVAATPRPEPASDIDLKIDPIGPLDAVRALYVSYFAIGHADSRQHIFDLLDTTEFNAVVIDVKGDHGWMSYPTQNSLAREIGAARPTAKNFEQIMAQFKARGIYTIGRLVLFKDNLLVNNYPNYAVKTETGDPWQDSEQMYWSDPFLKPVWNYNIQIALEAAQMGFDEIQFDYVRFPGPSHIGQPHFSQQISRQTRVAAITGFLSVAQGQLKPLGVKTAAKVFGYACWREDDSLIGQDIERMAQYLDVLAPMLYPTTFGGGIPGYKFAIAHPYEIVFESAKRAVERVSRLGCAVRPWIQDFPDYRFDERVYGREEIRAQIKGCFDAGCTGFMVWDHRIRYTEAAYAPTLVVAR